MLREFPPTLKPGEKVGFHDSCTIGLVSFRQCSRCRPGWSSPLLALLACFLVSACLPVDLSSSDPVTTDGCVVDAVIDGDTINVQGCADAGRIRLLQIDAPEVYPVEECLGAEASEYATDALLGRLVSLERDVRDTDPYDRMLRYVWLDGTLFNETIVAAGFARQVTYPPDVKYEARVVTAERTAQAAGRGVWSPNLCP